MGNIKQNFGGDWTEQKLHCLREYLLAYSKVMKNQKDHFTTFYIDAFAGTGYREIKVDNTKDSELLFPEMSSPESQQFLDGSAAIALGLDSPFERYIFIENNENKCKELEKLRLAYPELENRIEIKKSDANEVIKKICSYDWIKYKYRGVIFIDPFGMNVEWDTLKAIAETKALDLWLLFPLGIGVNRLLTKDGKMPQAWKDRLDKIFGENKWENLFYEKSMQTKLKLFETEEEQIIKSVNFNGIKDYFLERLKGIFEGGVAENPLILKNSQNNPMYLFCFAVSNPSPKAKAAALRIANHILG